MANTLIKDPGQPAAGGGGPASPGSGDSGGEGKPTLPPKDSPCYADLVAKVVQLWPFHQITFVESDTGATWLRVSNTLGYVWKVTGTCKNGYIEINYVLLQQPGGLGSD